MENRQINDVYRKNPPSLFDTSDLKKYVTSGQPPSRPDFGKINSMKHMFLLSQPYYVQNFLPSKKDTVACCNRDEYELLSNEPYTRFEPREDTDDSQEINDNRARDAHIIKAYKPIEIDDSEQQSLQVEILMLTYFVLCP